MNVIDHAVVIEPGSDQREPEFEHLNRRLSIVIDQIDRRTTDLTGFCNRAVGPIPENVEKKKQLDSSIAAGQVQGTRDTLNVLDVAMQKLNAAFDRFQDINIL